MNKEFTCVECPVGCRLIVTMEHGEVVRVEGNKCPRGAQYGAAEALDPRRILTGVVRAKGLAVAMVPVRTRQSIPKAAFVDAAAAVRGLVIDRPVRCGEVIVQNFLGLGTDLIATRECAR